MAAGSRYKYRLDRGQSYPDPASRFQPEGVHGPSEVVDPLAFQWSDETWPGLTIDDLIVYELHVGAYTPEGTFAALIDQLPELAPARGHRDRVDAGCRLRWPVELGI